MRSDPHSSLVVVDRDPRPAQVAYEIEAAASGDLYPVSDFRILSTTNADAAAAPDCLRVYPYRRTYDRVTRACGFAERTRLTVIPERSRPDCLSFHASDPGGDSTGDPDMTILPGKGEETRSRRSLRAQGAWGRARCWWTWLRQAQASQDKPRRRLSRAGSLRSTRKSRSPASRSRSNTWEPRGPTRTGAKRSGSRKRSAASGRW